MGSPLPEIRRVLRLLQVRRQVLLDRNVDEGGPDRGLLRVEIEMLMLDPFGLHRQQDEIALLPILALAVDDGIAPALQQVDDQAALMPVLARSRSDVVNEDAPMLQRRVLEGHGIEIEEKLALTGLEPLAVL